MKLKVGDIVRLPTTNKYARITQIEKKLNTIKNIWIVRTKYGWTYTRHYISEENIIKGLEKEILDDKIC